LIDRIVVRPLHEGRFELVIVGAIAAMARSVNPPRAIKKPPRARLCLLSTSVR
jgi:hypothetical protein